VTTTTTPAAASLEVKEVDLETLKTEEEEKTPKRVNSGEVVVRSRKRQRVAEIEELEGEEELQKFEATSTTEA
jgi:formylmethanofuran dehydrogenase subunit D